MEPTTTGSGPFHPAIRWNGILWTCRAIHSYASEDEAVEAASELIRTINDSARQKLHSRGFYPPPR